MTEFFSKYPRFNYDMTGTGTDLVQVVDIVHKVKFIHKIKKNIYVFYPYTIQDGETPEIIAAKLYGSAQYHWIVLFSNSIYNLWTDWPLSYDQFQDFIIAKYGDLITPLNQVYQYQDVDGNVIDYASYLANVSNGATILTSMEYETNLNNSKKQIVLLDPVFVVTVENELDKLLAEPT